MLAQVSFSPNATPTLNTGGWVYGAAVLLALLGAVIVAVVVAGYLRFSSRWNRDEERPRSVRAPRLQPGREPPRRAVNITGAPVVVPAPVAAGAASAPTAAAAPAARTPAAPTPAAAPTPEPAPVPAAASASTAAPAAPAPVPAAIAAPEPAPAAGETAPPAGPSPAAAPAAQAAPAAPPSAGEHKDVALDQDTFDAKLAELLANGTDRRVAEGQARRAAMIAARKKAEG